MSVSVGDTFVLGGAKWAIKLIDLDGTHPTNKTGKPRINASRFYKDEFGYEKVRKGRPSKFTVEEVFAAMGQEVPKSSNPENAGFELDTAPIDEAEKSWERVRMNESRVAELIGSLDDDSTDEDW
jgi:hypothetical protein